MRITRETLIPALHEAVPCFVIDPLWAEDNLGYPIINDLARHICEWASIGDEGEVKTALNFLEASLADGDAYVRDLVYECLETLLSCDKLSEIKVNFGPRLRDLWNEMAKYYRHIR
jgi:hypothetical protein